MIQLLAAALCLGLAGGIVIAALTPASQLIHHRIDLMERTQ